MSVEGKTSLCLTHAPECPLCRYCQLDEEIEELFGKKEERSGALKRIVRR